jgi:hypothetical protein
MESNKILGADILDILFEDNRAKGEGCERALASGKSDAQIKNTPIYLDACAR